MQGVYLFLQFIKYFVPLKEGCKNIYIKKDTRKTKRKKRNTSFYKTSERLFKFKCYEGKGWQGVHEKRQRRQESVIYSKRGFLN